MEEKEFSNVYAIPANYTVYLLAQGIAFTILANLGTDAITSPALVASLTLGTGEGGMGYEFCSVGNMLICIHILLDCSMILIAVVASLILLGEVAGVRKGSLICAVSTGFIIGWFFKFFPYWDKMYAALRGESRSNETNNADCA